MTPDSDDLSHVHEPVLLGEVLTYLALERTPERSDLVVDGTVGAGGHAKAIMTLGLPLIGGHLGQIAIGVTDTVMLGWYSVEALAAVTLGSTYYFVVTAVNESGESAASESISFIVD